MFADNQDVRRALDFGEFHPYFQPLVVLRSGQLAGFELLARWNHPQRGWIPPGEFISIAEKEGWIAALTGELLRKGFSAAAALSYPLKLSVNISPLQLRDPGLPEQIRDAAERTEFALERLKIEITESALTDDIELARATAGRLKSMGCRLVLDDFGTGYSSLSHLQSLPFDELKVDRSFVSSMAEQRDSRKIVAAVVGLGQSLGLTTVAEGVETQEQAEMLLWLGCELGQGWLYGKPVGAGEIVAVASAFRRQSSSFSGYEASGRVSCRSLDSLPAQRLAQLQAVYDGAPVGLAFLDCNLRYVNLNQKLAEMNGYPMVAHLGRTVPEVIPNLFPHVEPYIRRALRGEAFSGIEVTKPPFGAHEERTILLSYEPARDEAGEVVGVSVAVMDITTLKRAEKARHESEENFRHMMDLIPQIPWIIDPEGRALDVSQRWLDTTGMTEEQWRGFGWLNALHPDDLQPTLDAMHEAFRSGRPIDLEYRVQRPGGDWKRLRSRGTARIGAEGKIVCWYGCLEEVGEAG